MGDLGGRTSFEEGLGWEIEGFSNGDGSVLRQIER